MNKTALKFISAILLAAIAAGCVACGSSESGLSTNDGTSAPDDSSAVESAGEKSYTDDLPDADFEGYEFRIFSRVQAWYHGEWLTEEQNGDILNDAIYLRNTTVSERFNITFSEMTANNTDTARNTILAGDDAFDVINARCSHAWTYAGEGLLYSVSDLPYIDLSKGYWDESLNECLTICGNKYFAVGANNLTGYDYTHALVFNKQLAEDYQLRSPYELVKNGEWTFDTYSDMVKNVTSDVNGDSVMNEEDTYGFLSQAKAVLPGFWISAGVLSVNKNNDDEPVFTMPNDSKFINVFEKIYQMTWDNDSWYVNNSVTNNDSLLSNMFQSGKGLFMDMTFFFIESLREMEADFGIIPYPKYDESQQEYYSRIEGCELSCVPVTISDPECTSMIIEALACESARLVQPAYYDVSLRTKYTRDEESMEMLDIIFNHRVFDLGDTIWCDQLRDGVFKGMFLNNDRAISSKFASMESVMNEQIESTIEAFRSVN